jgi:hypothetical protein
LSIGILSDSGVEWRYWLAVAIDALSSIFNASLIVGWQGSCLYKDRNQPLSLDIASIGNSGGQLDLTTVSLGI